MNIIPEFKNKTIVSVLINLVCLAVVVLVSKLIWFNVEGFTQNEPFILKTGAGVFDDFYVEAYDDIFLPDNSAKATVKAILNATGERELGSQTDEPLVRVSEKSRFLDVGSGTGSVVSVLGKRCKGIDKSDAMVKKCNAKCGNPNASIQGDVLDPMAFSRYQFSHILCLDKTIYELGLRGDGSDVPLSSALSKFFNNCRMWLQNGGYLIVQLVDPKKFNTIVPAGMPAFIANPQKYVSQRITKSEVDFGGHTYTADYNMQSNIFTETFRDKASGKVRQNERRLEFMDEASIVKQAYLSGFSLHGKINMEPINGDEHQSLFIFV